MTPSRHGKALGGLDIIVVGAGPGGLAFAKGALENGARVRIFEQAGDPRGDDPGYTDRSFNLTLNSVGRKALGDKRAWSGSTDVVGRAIHNFGGTGDIKYTSFGNDDDALLKSVPRPKLRQNLVSIVEELGAELQFRTDVLKIHENVGKIEVKDVLGGQKTVAADLVVIADGLHSLADEKVESLAGNSLNMRVEPLSYVTVPLLKEACKDQSMHHIHFWRKPESKSVAIALPNKDGTLAVLLISKFDNEHAVTAPFSTPQDAKQRLEHDFSELLELDPTLPDRVLGRTHGHFYYKSITKYVLGKRCVVVGDAGSACPPWAGFGANTAIYSGDALVRFLKGFEGDIHTALQEYEKHKLTLAGLVLEYAELHGEFLSNTVSKNPAERPIGPILRQIVHKTMELSPAPENVELLYSAH